MCITGYIYIYIYIYAAAKSLQWCPTLCDPIDCSPPGSPIPGILQARTLEWVAISFITVTVKASLESLIYYFFFKNLGKTINLSAWPLAGGFCCFGHWSGTTLNDPHVHYPGLTSTVSDPMASIAISHELCKRSDV